VSNIYQAPAQLTQQHCGQLLGALDQYLQQGDTCVDFQGVNVLDSSAVALLLEWRRRAQSQRRQLSLIHLPRTLTQLIEVYAVQEILQIKA
jgi:phospholipid transport system transporter-binding protein